MPAVAVTDHGNMYCAWKFMKACAAINHDEQGNFLQKVKPIIGCEFYMCENLYGVGYENKEYYHLILLAKNNVGYYNLCRLNSIAFVDGFYYKPRIDFDTLKKYSEGADMPFGVHSGTAAPTVSCRQTAGGKAACPAIQAAVRRRLLHRNPKSTA